MNQNRQCEVKYTETTQSLICKNLVVVTKWTVEVGLVKKCKLKKAINKNNSNVLPIHK